MVSMVVPLSKIAFIENAPHGILCVVAVSYALQARTPHVTIETIYRDGVALRQR